ncbi:ABC transporter ATP-binding protein [Candidatus Allofournierella merdipullorum]|uniref:ABC transporter ATP-binding protein n=1 Tax=Candidatus Allofournierella merdipullorum TaxID=2838595 RepID=UPI002A8F06D5|nr:ATP-binding cassette domain-containing protein [Candidatus Fournierella merdipullorum]
MIEVRHLTKQYGAKTALNDVSFSVPRGQVLGLLGLNGAGKSTTMNIIAGCLAATSGTVTIDGVDIVKDPLAAKKKIGYLPEIPPLYVDMKVEDFLSFVYELKGLRGDRRGALGQVCEKAGVTNVRGRIIKNLSKGYRQRVGLAAAMLGEPAVLILDEPTVGLDPTQIIEIRSLIEQVGREHTVILSSHILSEIQAVCERVIVLNEGRLVADDTPENLENAIQSKNSCVALIEGEPEQVLAALERAPSVESAERLGLSEPGVWEYRIRGKEDADIRRDVFNVLSEAHLPLLGTRSAHVTLEDVFLRLVGAQTETAGEEAPQE